MMKTRDYEAIASALREGLNTSERWVIFCLLSPVFHEMNPRYNARKFGESLGVPNALLNETLNKMEEVDENAR